MLVAGLMAGRTAGCVGTEMMSWRSRALTAPAMTVRIDESADRNRLDGMMAGRSDGGDGDAIVHNYMIIVAVVVDDRRLAVNLVHLLSGHAVIARVWLAKIPGGDEGETARRQTEPEAD